MSLFVAERAFSSIILISLLSGGEAMRMLAFLRVYFFGFELENNYT